MVSCSIIGCKNRTERKDAGITFHGFPTDPVGKHKWVTATGRIHWEPTKYSRICSTHFDSHLFTRRLKKSFLIHGALPSINIHSPYVDNMEFVCTDETMYDPDSITLIEKTDDTNETWEETFYSDMNVEMNEAPSTEDVSEDPNSRKSRVLSQKRFKRNNYSILGVNSKNDTANGAAENDNEDEEVKKIYVSSDGKVYEIEGSTELNDQLHTNNDGEILFEQLPTPPKKRKRIKRDSQTESPDQSNTSSHPLDHLAKYLVSILKELPRPISSELQLKFVQQALEAKLKCDNDRTVNGDSTSDVEEK